MGQTLEYPTGALSSHVPFVEKETMEAKCECGHAFEVPDDAKTAKCPQCGRDVEVAAGGDWLADLDMDELSLEEELPEREAADRAEPAAQAPQPGAPQEQGALDLEGMDLELEGEGGRPAARRPAAPTAPRTPGQRTGAPVAKVKEAEPPPAPKGVLVLAKLLSQQPKIATSHLERGIKEPRFLVELGASFLVLLLLSGPLLAYAAAPRSFALNDAFVNCVRFLLDAVAACLMFSLVAVGLKKETAPLGVCEGVVGVRVAALVVAVALSGLLALTLFLIGRLSGGAPPGALLWFGGKVTWVYLLIVAGGQMMVAGQLVKLGCSPAGGLGLVVTIATYTLANTIIERVALLFG
jgi:hypothetical protein